MQRGARRGITGALILTALIGLVLGVSMSIPDSPPAERKRLARSLLHDQRPAEAGTQLQAILREGPDAEAFWLLSRAFLQQGDLSKAREALNAATSFSAENPLLPEPAPPDMSLAKANAEKSGGAFRQDDVAKAYKKAESPIPKKYESTTSSKLKAKVEAQSNKINFDLKDD